MTPLPTTVRCTGTLNGATLAHPECMDCQRRALRDAISPGEQLILPAKATPCPDRLAPLAP